MGKINEIENEEVSAKCRKCQKFFSWSSSPDILCPKCRNYTTKHKLKVSVDLGEEMVALLDAYATKHSLSRSEVVAHSLQYLRLER